MSLPRRFKGAGLMVAATLTGAALGTQAPLTSMALLTDTGTVSGNVVTTRPACSAGTGYADAVQAMNPTFYWRMGESTPPAVTSVNDSTASDIDGTVRGTGLTFGAVATGLIQCEDTYGVDFPGGVASTDFIVQPNPSANPDTFTISAWVRTNSNDGGWVLGMASSRWGTSTNRDRVLYVQANGRPSFAVGITPRTLLEGPAPVNDNAPHLLVGTLDASGMSLYVDGQRVAFDATVTAGESYVGNEPADPPPLVVPPTPDGMGYWRVGYDSTFDLGPAAPNQDQLAGTIDEVAVWETQALTPTEVSGLFSQNHW